MDSVFCVEGMRYFGELAARLFDCDLCVGEDAHGKVFVVGMYGGNTVGHTQGCERIIMWCGTDVKVLQTGNGLPEAIHLCDSDGLREELYAKGIIARTLPWPSAFHPDPTPLGEHVAVYFGGQAEKYSPELTAWVMSQIDAPFITYHHGDYDDMQEVVDQTRLYLRLTPHDGGAMSAREFLEAGRRVVTTQPIPYARRVRLEDPVGMVQAVRAELAEGLNEEAAEFYRDFNSEERFLRGIP